MSAPRLQLVRLKRNCRRSQCCCSCIVLLKKLRCEAATDLPQFCSLFAETRPEESKCKVLRDRIVLVITKKDTPLQWTKLRGG